MMAEKKLKENALDSHTMNSSKRSLRWREEVKVTYRVEEIPPLMVTLFLGFQHYISISISTLTIPLLLAPAICLYDDHVGLSEITGTLFVASGLITLLQTFFGVRLPIIQSGTYALMIPTLSYLSLPQWQCPCNIKPYAFNTTGLTESYIITGSSEHREIWMTRLREIQGCILIAAMFEVVVGLTGVVGWMMKFIGPLTICPTVTLIGFSLFKSAPAMSSKHWPIAVVVLVLMVVFSQFCGRFKVPCFIYSRERKWHTQKFQIFKMFPIVLAIMITWLLCYVLTITDYFPSNSSEYGYHARTDVRTQSIQKAPWFRLPYPGQWGLPTFSVSGILAIFSGVLVTMIESVGDYYSCAKLSGAPPPPIHAINRGILVEGLGSMLTALLGTGNGTTSASTNIGVVGITKVGSRVVVQVTAVIMILFGLFTKVGAVFLSIPEPIIGGTFFILFSMIVAIGLSNLQHVNMNSSRNLFILGSSLLFGLAIPEWIISSSAVIQTGNVTLDNILLVLLKTQMFIGGMIGFVLDNTIPGSRRFRGMEYWDRLRDYSVFNKDGENTINMNSNNFTELNQKSSDSLQDRLSKTYDLPLVSKFLSRFEFLRKIPLCPSYRGFLCGKGCCEGSECCKNSLFKKINMVFKAVNVACNKDEDEEEDELEDIELIVPKIIDIDFHNAISVVNVDHDNK